MRSRIFLVVTAVATLAAVTHAGTGTASPAAVAAATRPTTAQILLARPLTPTDVNLLSTAIYPNARAMVPAAGAAPSESTVAAMLDSYLAADLPHDAAARNAAKAVFNSDATKAKIASPSLRAALASLEGTFARPAINYVVNQQTTDGNPKVITVEFMPTADLSNPANVAEVHDAATADPQQQVIWFNQRYEAENPFLFTSTFAHEVLHEDASVPHVEEEVNWSLDQLVYLGQLRRHPQLARTGTELSRRLNSNAVVRLNSGRGARLGLLHSNRNRTLFPNSPVVHIRSWWDKYHTNDSATSPGNAVLAAYLAGIHHAGGKPCSGKEFSVPLLYCIDEEQDGPLTNPDLVAAAKAIKLDTQVTHNRSIRLAGTAKHLSGKLVTKVKACRSRQLVNVYWVRHGKTKKVATVATNSTGAFHHNAKPGRRYRASVPARTTAGVGVCGAAKSGVVTS